MAIRAGCHCRIRSCSVKNGGYGGMLGCARQWVLMERHGGVATRDMRSKSVANSKKLRLFASLSPRCARDRSSKEPLPAAVFSFPRRTAVSFCFLRTAGYIQMTNLSSISMSDRNRLFWYFTPQSGTSSQLSRNRDWAQSSFKRFIWM